jgi:hypothetical protein
VEGEITEFASYKTQFAEHLVSVETEHTESVTKKKSEGGEQPQDEEEVKAVDVDNLKGKQGVPDFWWRSIKNN